MSKEYRKREEGNELIKRFEDHLRKKKAEFFDLDAYEQIIEHYMFRGKHNKALQAVNLAITSISVFNRANNNQSADIVQS